MSFSRLITWPYRVLFEIPPLEKRPQIKGPLKSFIYHYYNPISAESYLYYKLFMLNLIMNIIFSALFWVMYLYHIDVDLGFYTIPYVESRPLDTFLYQYPKKIFSFTMGITTLYMLLLLGIHSDLFSKKKIIPYNNELKVYMEQEIFNLRPIRYVGMVIFVSVCFWYMEAFPSYLREYGLYNQIFNFRGQSIENYIFFNFLYLFLYQTLITNGFAFGLVNFIRFLSTRYLNSTSSDPSNHD